VSLIDEFSGNSTFKERFELYQKYKREGRLEIRAGQINSAASALPNGFHVKITDAATGKQETIEARKLINCASMLRTPYFIDQKTGQAHSPDPVTESALQNGLIAPDTVHKILNPSGPYADGTVGIVGPAHGGTWGIPYTRDAFEEAAKAALKKALSQAKPVPVPPGPEP
jgi:hypothetical protein